MSSNTVLDLITVLVEIVLSAIKVLRNPDNKTAKDILSQVPLTTLKRIAAESRAAQKFSGT